MSDNEFENQHRGMEKFKVVCCLSIQTFRFNMVQADMTKPWTSSIPMTQVQDRGIVKFNFSTFISKGIYTCKFETKWLDSN